MAEIEVGAVGYAGEKRAVPSWRASNAVPSDLRHFAFSGGNKLDDGCGNQAESIHSGGFLAGFAKQLEAKAYAEKRPVRTQPIDEGFHESAAAQIGHAVAKGSNAGQNQRMAMGQFGRRNQYLCFCLDEFQRIRHAAKVAHAVVYYANHSTPLLEGMPLTLGSRVQAAFIARANPLNTDS